MSVHIGSQIRSAEPFGAAMERVIKLVRQLEQDGIAHPRHRRRRWSGHRLSRRQTSIRAAKLAEYAAALQRSLEGLRRRLLLEPGRFLVAQAGALVTRVLHVKRNGNKTFVITDAAMNDLIRPALYQAHHEIVPVVRVPAKRVLWMWSVRCAKPATSSPATACSSPSSRATWLRCSMPAPMAWRKARTTTPVPVLPRFWSKAEERGSSAAARRWPICLDQSE